MIGRLTVVALALGLASCAGLEPAGRNARTPASAPSPAVTPALPPPSETTTPTARAPLAAPPQTQQQPQAVPAPTPSTPPPAPVAAPQVSVPAAAPTPPARPASPDDDIVVPGQVQTQVPPPAGDPRTNEERRADVRAWDQCVMQVQSAFDSDPMRPQLTTPEEYCAQSLGMAERTAVPISRQNRRR